MSAEAYAFIEKVASHDRGERANAYTRLFEALRRGFVSNVRTVQFKLITSAIAEDMKSADERLPLCALNLLSWFLSGNLSTCPDVTTREVIGSSAINSLGDEVLRLLHCDKYDVILMCMFVLAQQTELDWLGLACNSQCAVQVVRLASSGDIVSQLCQGKMNLNPTKNTSAELASKLVYWSYKALTRLAELRAIRYDLLDTLAFATLCEVSFAAIMKVLNDKSEHFTLPLFSTVSNSNEEGILLPLVQLEFLVNVPVGKGLVSCLQQMLATTGLIGDTISSALKKSSVSEVVVHRCSLLWQLWVHIAAELLVPQDLPPELILASGGDIAATVIDGAGGGEGAKNAFMSLLAPKNGVGVLTAPLQPILRRSRREAARCYLTLAQCLVLAQDWHQPASVLKLLLRCLYHLLFTDMATTSNTATTVNTSSKSNIPSTTSESEEVIKRERDNLLALKTAGEAVQVLCANIPRKHLRAVPLISISLGRLPSAVCGSTNSSPRARKTTVAASAAPTAGAINTGPAVTAVATGSTLDRDAVAAFAPITPGKGAQQSASEASTCVPTAVSSERASLDIIIRKLLDTTELNTVFNGSSGLGDITASADEPSVLVLLVMALSRVQHVCSGAVALSSMLSSLGPPVHEKSNTVENTGATSSSAPSNMHTVAAGKATRSKNHHHFLSKGLFASPSKITIKLVGTTNTSNTVSNANNNINNNNAAIEPLEEPLACADILNHMQHLHTAMTSIATTDSIYARLSSTHAVVYKKLVGSLDFTSQLHNACAKLTTSWQLCILALAQALFDDLALTEGTYHREGDEITLSAPRYQSTQLDSFSLLFSAPTQSSQIYQHHQHHHLQNTTINHNKRSPHKFSNTSPSQSSRVKTSLPSSYPNLDSPLNAAGASPMMQVVLCSAHPPAVQAAVDLCSVFVKVWVDVWLSTSLGRQQHKQRAVFVESFWWFLHRITAFGVDVNDGDAEVLFSAVLRHCPELSVLHCPTNMAGIAMLVSICHAHLCDTFTPPAPSQSLSQPPPAQSHSASLDILLRALHQSMNSMTESGVLPGLFAWVPPLLARLRPSDADSSSSNNMQGSSITSTSRASKGECVVAISASHFLVPSEQCVRFLCSFLRHALQQLSSMSVPSASEQHSPSLMHNMISGLRCLLVSPLVLCVTGMRGLYHLFEDNMSVLPHDSTATTPVSPAQQVINNWKSILSLWLELREFTVVHFGEEENDLAASGKEVDPSLAWIDALLGQDTVKVTTVPFRLHSTIYAQDEQSRTQMVRSADESVHKDLQASLLQVQAALEVSVQHRRKYPRSPLTTGLAVSAASILVSICASLCATCDARLGLVGETKECTVVTLKAIDGLLNKVLPLIPTLDAHLAELGAGKLLFFIPYLGESSLFGCQLVEAVFKSIFQCITNIHHSPQTAMSSRYVKQWTLAVLSSLCAHQNTQTNRVQSGFGFRSAASTLAVGEPHRIVVRAFVSLLTTTNSGDRMIYGVDAEIREFIITAWRELGGADNEIISAFDRGVAGDESTKSVTSEAPASSTVEQPGSLAALPGPPGSTVGVKRSFVPALASPVPVLAGAINESFSSPPPKVPKVAPSNAHVTPVAPVTYVKVALHPSELASLAQKTSNTRQGFVPATYTGADRANLNEQSQQSQAGTNSQLISQLASQAMPPPLSPLLRVTAQARSPLTGSEPQVFPTAQSAPVSGSHPLPSLAIENHAKVQHVYMQAFQHSDSTTYVSPSPALGNSSASMQRRQSMMGLSAPRTPASLPLLDDMQCESVPADTEPTVIAQDSRNNSNSNSGSSRDSSSLPVQNHAAGDSYGAMDVAQSELDHNNHTVAPESHHSEGETHNSHRTQAVLAVSAELHHTIQQLSAQNTISTTTSGGLLAPQQASRADLLGAAIRQSHKLTGILLDLLSENPTTEER